MEMITYVRSGRGVFGILVSGTFWGFHLVMLLWVGIAIATLFNVTPDNAPGSGMGFALGGTLALGWIAGFWAAGSIILGSMMYFTQPPLRRVVKGSKVEPTQNKDPLIDPTFKSTNRS